MQAVAVSHYNAICAIVQTAMSNLIYERYAPWKDQRFRPGDVCDGSKWSTGSAGLCQFDDTFVLISLAGLPMYRKSKNV